MRVAQGLYERGFITYMRTDSVTLSAEALGATRAAVANAYGQQYLSPQPKQYSSKSKNAQEAHEAIRPTTPYRSPDQVASELNPQDLALYRLVWQRTLASQMADATGVTMSIRLGAVSTHEQTDCEFNASGTTITFAGYRAVYVASDADDGTNEALLPPLTVGDVVPVESLTPTGHTTSPPARYTEASLVKRLEELEIGRPSTWASIIQTIQDRGYVWKKGQALVPSWTAFAVVTLLEQHFGDLVDYQLTAKMDADLDEIASGEQRKEHWLDRFYFGDDDVPGLKRTVEENLDAIDAAAINTFPLGHDPDGVPVVVKPGKYGPYVKRGDDTAGVPDDLAPDELTIAKALELLALPKSDEPIGEIDGYPVYAKNGRYGPYVQWGDQDDLPPGLTKPKMSSLFATMSLGRITIDDAEKLLQLPRSLGADPVDGEEIIASNGRYGPYIAKGKEYRSLDAEDQLFEIDLERASAIFQLPKVFRRGNRNLAAAGPLREFGTDPVSERAVVAKDGKFGVYVTDGETNASIGKGDRIEEMLPERAFELLAIRREQVAAKGGPAKKTVAKKPVTKKTTAKKTTARKTTARKTTAKKTTAKKTAAKKPAAG
jgi:DNA topoisomerase-1